MSKKIITISREFGSGGRYIGEHLAEKLGYELYDRDLIAKVIDRTLLPESLVLAYNEALQKDKMVNTFYFGDTLLNDTIIEAQKKIIYELAEKQNCILVGRCANFYLKEWDRSLHIFIEADDAFRLERIALLNDCNAEEAKRLMKEYDKKRQLYYQYCTNHKWGDRKDYDVVLNSSKIGLDKCVDLLADLC